MFENLITDDLYDLYQAFKQEGYNLWFVGGAVRDCLLGKEPNDIDLCTDATPEEQAGIYSRTGVKCIPTGLHHGTYTVVFGDESFEITSLRDSSGQYTKSLTEDLGQRDFTINAMAATFDKVLIDPFGGETDLNNKMLKFVGDTDAALRADPVRMLRFFRFSSLLGVHLTPPDTIFAAEHHNNLKDTVNRQRIWTEVQKALLSPHADHIMRAYALSGAGSVFGLLRHHRNIGKTIIADTRALDINDPITLMVALIENTRAVQWSGQQLRWTSREMAHAAAIAECMNGPMSIAAAKIKIATGVPRQWVFEAAKLMRADDVIELLSDWKVPKFPLSEEEVGDIDLYHEFKLEWAHSGFRIGEAVFRKRLA